MLREFGVKVRVEEVKRIGEDREKGREMVMVKLGNKEQKREVMGSKNKLKGRKEKIIEDWTWKERKMRWKLEEIARYEERKRNKVWIGYGKIRVGKQWWRWDEEEEVLRDGRGNIRWVEQEEGGKGNGEEKS